MLVAVERVLHEVDPTSAVEDPKTLEQIRDDSLASRTFAMQLLVGFSIAGGVLSLVGIYGVLSLSVASRRRELAIRTAIGAEPKDVRNLIFGEGIPIDCGRGVGGRRAGDCSVARAAYVSVRSAADGSGITLIMVACLFVGVAMLACWAPVRRATKIDPLEALRYE